MNDFFTKLFKLFEPAQAKLEPAIKAGLVNKVRKLLAKGVDPNKCGVSGDTPLYLACDEGNLDVIKLLLAAKADARSGTSPLFAAVAGSCTKEKAKIVRLLLAAGADVNAIADSSHRWSIWRTLLHAATGEEEVVKLFLEAGANVNAMDELGATPLHSAAYRNDTGAGKLFLAAGADVNAPDKYGSTPLHEASTENQIEVVSLLLAMGADVNARDTYGATPLHKASKEGHLLVIELLLAAGANVRIADKGGNKPIDLAIQEGHREEVQLLNPQLDVSKVEIFVNYNDWVDARGPFYDHGRPIGCVDYLLALGVTGRANLRAEYEKERQWFMETTLNNKQRIVEEPVREAGDDRDHLGACMGAPLEQCNFAGHKWASGKCSICGMIHRHHCGFTDFHLAISENAELIGIRSLCSNGLVNVGDDENWTPLMKASGKEGNLAIVKLLVESGADVNAQSKKGTTALSMAALHDKQDVVEFLTSHGAVVDFTLREL
jgi:ankyrin repeat protein